MKMRYAVLCAVVALILLCASCSSADPSSEPSPQTTSAIGGFLNLHDPTADDIAATADIKYLYSLVLWDCHEDVVLPNNSYLEHIRIEWCGGEDGTIDLTGCYSLRMVTLEGETLPGTFKLGPHIDTLSFYKNEGKFDEDYIAALPNIMWLCPNTSFDLSKLPALEALELQGPGWTDLSALEDIQIHRLHLSYEYGIDDEALSTFRGAKSLKTMSICDENITDISPILDHAPELEQLTLYADPDQDWVGLNGVTVTSGNPELLDRLETPIPREQLDELIERGCAIYLMPSDFETRS